MRAEDVNRLIKAAEQALQYFEDAHGLEDIEVEIKEALRQALDDKPPVKSYCGGKPNYCTPVDNVYMSEERVHKTDKSMHEPEGWVTLPEPSKPN